MNSRIGYVLLWFPLASETFIFREVQTLRDHGLDVQAWCMYGLSSKGLSQEMTEYSGPVRRFGASAFFTILGAFTRALARQPKVVLRLLRRGLFRKMRNLEAQGENLWCFMAGFLLAEQCQANNIALIHAPWANGPATAAWVASQLTNIPFAFSGRAGDIYPQDGILAEKAADALFIRTNNAANVEWLARFCPPGQSGKVKLIYNGLTLANQKQRPEKKPTPPYRILAVGRFARTKGFPELLTAMARLKREKFLARLTLIGDGNWRHRLLKLRKRLNLEDCVDMPGFVPNDKLGQHMRDHDLLVVPSVIYKNGDRDGIPNVIMEAASIGLPVVATDVCGISEVIRPDETGWLVKPRDSFALANAIRQALENPQQTESMAQNAHKVVREMFDPQKNSVRLRNLYLSAIGGNLHDKAAAGSSH